MNKKNAKLAREWLDKAYGDAEFLTPSLTALLDQKDTEWELDVRGLRRELRSQGPTGIAVAGACDEILKRRGIKP